MLAEGVGLTLRGSPRVHQPAGLLREVKDGEPQVCPQHQVAPKGADLHRGA